MTELQIHKARLERNLASGAFDVHVCSDRARGETVMLKPLATPTFHHLADGEYHPPEPAFQLTEQSAQALLDALWEGGIRPSSGQKESVGDKQVIALMKEHLADLRRMAFLSLSPDTPKQPSTF